MKPKHLLLVVVLIIASCKVKEKDVVGFYKSNNIHFTINPNHTFSYSYIDAEKFNTPYINVDSYHFITSGKWEIKKDSIILNSYDNTFTDTSEIKKISKTPINSKLSSFSIKALSGLKIGISNVYKRGYKSKFIERRVIYDGYFWNIDMDVSKNDTLTFYPTYYKPFQFTKTDSLSFNYVITLVPKYKPNYFINKTIKVKRNRLIYNKAKLKKDKSIKNDPAI